MFLKEEFEDVLYIHKIYQNIKNENPLLGSKYPQDYLNQLQKWIQEMSYLGKQFQIAIER